MSKNLYSLLFIIYTISYKGGRLNWQNFIRGLIVSTLIFGGIILFLTFLSSPDENSLAVWAYFISIFFFIGGVASVVGFLFRKWWMHNEVLFSSVKTSIRQGFIFSSFCCALLVLSTMRLLTWWDALIMTICVVLIELYFKTRS